MAAAIEIARMATPEPIVPSRRLSAAISAERDRLARELQRRRAKARALARDLAAEEEAINALADRIRLLDEVSGNQGQHAAATPSPHPHAAQSARGVLRGARIRQVAVELLAASEWRDQPVHYADWFRLVETAGYAIAGRDPQAAFLTQITRSPLVRRFDRPGTYQLDPHAVEALAAQAAHIRDQLAQLPFADIATSAEDAQAVREQRGRLTTALARTEAQLDEAQAGLAAARGTTRRAS
jgi:hypothetical protein